MRETHEVRETHLDDKVKVGFKLSSYLYQIDHVG